ncbi:MAG: capsular polysaccharide biosynthesis protein [Clostridia bacterium]|nr:capsular polysaccharide biosynthesis protein [Clostridia bacterium]
MTDYHSHILPGIDDGSKNIEESIKLLAMLREQGVDISVATPHFYADRTTPGEFLSKRQAAYESLVLYPEFPGADIRLGAEVSYFPGISRISALRDLRIEGTKLLLLEMPFTKWSEYTLREISELSCSGDVVLMLAHMERYLEFQSRGTAEELAQMGILIQCNASFFANKATSRKAFRMLKKGLINAVGSDCHSVDARPPRFDEFRAALTEKFGPRFLDGFIDENDSLLEVFV